MSQMVHGLYTGPIQSVTLEGKDYSLTPGKEVEVPACPYVGVLIATGLLTPTTDSPATPDTTIPAAQ